MFDETDMSRERQWYAQNHGEQVIVNLRKRNVEAWFVPNCKEALSLVLELIPEGVSVGRGDSVSVDQIGIIEALRKRNKNTIIDPHERDSAGNLKAGWEGKLHLSREALHSDVFITGTNAITLDGKLFNVDGFGNRVSAMIFGPSKVIVVLGINKIVRGLDEAYERVHQYAARMNAKRHVLKHHWYDFDEIPCVKTGKCIDCYHDMCMCRYTTIIAGNMKKDRGRMNVVLVGEELGI